MFLVMSRDGDNDERGMDELNYDEDDEGTEAATNGTGPAGGAVAAGSGSSGDADGGDGDEGRSLADASNLSDEPDIETLQRRVREIEEEAEKIRQMQSNVEKQMNMSATSSQGGAPGDGGAALNCPKRRGWKSTLDQYTWEMLITERLLKNSRRTFTVADRSIVSPSYATSSLDIQKDLRTWNLRTRSRYKRRRL